MQKQKILTGVALLFIAGLFGAIVLSSNSFGQKEGDNSVEEKLEAKFTIFTSENCPFCKDVEQWVEQNQADESLDIAIKEVTDDRKYARELEQAAISCRINPTQVGVPFMYADGECFSGSLEIIGRLSQEPDLQPLNGEQVELQLENDQLDEVQNSENENQESYFEAEEEDKSNEVNAEE